MSRVVSKSRAAKQLKENKNSSVVKRPEDQSQITKNNKDGWEMSAREALLVNFVVSEI
tara:strand:+ start:25194 stop:25367 length:174 start_codon:yes stop_codon:yes gene_type:complete